MCTHVTVLQPLRLSGGQWASALPRAVKAARPEGSLERGLHAQGTHSPCAVIPRCSSDMQHMTRLPIDTQAVAGRRGHAGVPTHLAPRCTYSWLRLPAADLPAGHTRPQSHSWGCTDCRALVHTHPTQCCQLALHATLTPCTTPHWSTSCAHPGRCSSCQLAADARSLTTRLRR